jgi:septin 7
LGKSTLINTLFNTTLYPPKEPPAPNDERPQTVAIQSISAGNLLSALLHGCYATLTHFSLDIEENGVRLRLTVVDTPGFGDFVNNDDRQVNLSNHFIHFLPYVTCFILAGNLSLKTLKPVSTRISNKKTASTGKNLWIIASMPVCTSSSRLVTREYIFIDVAFMPVTNLSRSLKPLDIEFMRRLHTKVNLIPVIAKADTLTDDEVAEFKARVS